MGMRSITANGVRMVVVEGRGIALASPQDALDLLAEAWYAHESACLILPKEAVAEDFFVLRTRLAGEILQKIVNYRARLGIFGDFSGYESRALADFIHESNRGGHICFVDTQDEAVRWLSREGLSKP